MSTPREIDDDAPVPAKLRFAIANKRLLGIEYNARLRVVEPHDFGAMNGTSRLFVYQLLVDGAAGGDRAQGWRLLDVGKITACKCSSRRSPAAAAMPTKSTYGGTPCSPASSSAKGVRLT